MVTGASSGIGAETARELARRGWRVAVAGRDPERTHQVAQRIGGDPFVADFDRLDEVRTLAREILDGMKQVDVLVNNAGGIVTQRELSVDGHELTLQRNVLGSVVLTEALMGELVERSGRIVHTASLMHRVARLDTTDLNYDRRAFRQGWPAYADAKLGVVLYAKNVAARTGLESYPVHPGYVASNFGPDTPLARRVLKLSRPLQISVPAGAAPLVHLVDTPELEVENGNYFDGLNPFAQTHPATKNAALVERYWEAVSSRVG